MSELRSFREAARKVGDLVGIYSVEVAMQASCMTAVGALSALAKMYLPRLDGVFASGIQGRSDASNGNI